MIETRPALPDEEATVYEGDLADEMGLSRESLRDVRIKVLIKDRDWQKKKNRVFLTESAVAWLKKEWGALEAFAASEASGEALAKQDDPVTLTVHCIARNPKILDARKKDGGLVRVQVRDNRNFMQGMEITAKPGGEFPDVYVQEGRCPRWRGRW